MGSHIDWREKPAVARTLTLKGVDCEIPYQLERRTSASKDDESRRGVDCEISHRLERGTSANEDTRPQRGLIVRSHINLRGELVPVRTLGLEGG